MNMNTIKQNIRFPAELHQFIERKADKQALLSGKKPNWSQVVIRDLTKLYKLEK